MDQPIEVLPGASDECYRRLFESLADPVFVVDQGSGLILEVTPAAAPIYGYTRAELLGQGIALVAAEPEQALRDLRPGPLPKARRDHRRRDGSLFPVEVIASVVEWDGRPAVVQVVRDVTERVRAEEALRESKSLVEAVLENVPLMVFLKEATDLRFVLFNRAGEELVGYDRSTFLGKNNLDLFPPDQAAHFMSKDREVLDGAAGVLDIPEEEILTATQGLRLLHTRKVCIRGADGTTKYLLGVSEDITERKRAEAALKASEERFREIIMASPVPLALNDDQQRITFLNPAYTQAFGYTLEDIPTLAEWWPRAYPDPAYRRQVAEAWQAELDRSRRTGEPFTPQEVEMRCRDGSDRSVLASAASLSPAWFGEHLIVLFDITERKRLQVGLAQADRLSSMGMLAAGVAHEINNPLTYVLANVDAVAQDLQRLAGDGAGPVDLARLQGLATCVQGALEGIHRIRKISQSLGSFSRVERVELAHVDLNLAVQAAVTMAHNEVKYRARLVTELGQVPTVLASDGKLSQVFLNLILNAAHAIDEGRVDDHRILVRTWTTGDHVLAEVSDTGHGIRPEDLERIFEPFFTTKQPGAGSGLGLAISRNIVSGFGGDLRVESQVGQGARFVVRLPACPAPPAGPPGAAAPERPARQPVRGRILVVDDEEQVRRVLVRLLGSQHEVVAVASGREGQVLLERDRGFDVILCDLMMPELTGMDLHAWLVDLAPALASRVVFMSGGAFTPRASDYMTSVGNLQIEKPFDPATLREVVLRLVAEARGGR
ncbi:MAG: PAS domain S-box protein [Anaeromyxobacter sp.]|nr:PAS domain S-box protein [Anaeromyxobacter sp.]